MKVRRFNNLWTMGLILCAVILVVIYVGKIFFPTLVIEIAQSETICKIGHYIDTHKWAWYITNALLGFATLYLLVCATCRKKVIDIKDLSVIITAIIVLELVKIYLPKQYTALNLSFLLVIPCILKGDLRIAILWFVSTSLVQTFTLEIRNLVFMISDINTATALILTIDVYIVELLICFASNYKGGI
jgi:hypothetical protein